MRKSAIDFKSIIRVQLLSKKIETYHLPLSIFIKTGPIALVPKESK
jgi:hypothetical protein